MIQYEVTFIVDPVLSGDEIKATAQTYVDLLTKEAKAIVHIDEMGLRQLAYPINRRTSGVYYCIEFQVETGEMISKMELALRRDERIMRFLTVRLDKYGIKYNDDKRNGLIGKKKDKDSEKDKEKEKDNNRRDRRDRRDNRDSRGPRRDNTGAKAPSAKAPAPKAEPAVKAEPAAQTETAAKEEEE